MQRTPSSAAQLGGADPSDGEEPPPASRRELRKQARADRTRDAILEATAESIAQVGYEATTMELVAQRAGYSVGSLYNYFKSKDALLHALAVKLFKEANEAMRRPLPASLTARQRLELLALRLLEELDKARGWLLSLAQALPSSMTEGEELIPRELAEMKDASTQMLTDEMRAAQGAGLVRAGDPQLGAVLFVSVLKGLVVEWVFLGGKGSATELAPLIVELTLDGVGAHESTPQEG